MLKWEGKALKAGQRFELFWEYKGLRGTGYSFPCDADGNVDVEQLTGLGKESYESLVSGKDPMPIGQKLKTPRIIIVGNEQSN